MSKARAVRRYLAASRHRLSGRLLICGALVVGTSGVGRAGPGTITEFNVPTFGSDPLGIAAGPGNTLWVADSNDFDVHKVERFSTDGAMTGAFNVPGGASVSCPQGCVDPAGILLGPDGNIWFTELTQVGGIIPLAATVDDAVAAIRREMSRTDRPGTWPGDGPGALAATHEDAEAPVPG